MILELGPLGVLGLLAPKHLMPRSVSSLRVEPQGHEPFLTVGASIVANIMVPFP